MILFSLAALTLSYAFPFVINEYVKPERYYQVKSDADFIVFGNSHPECAINDSLVKGCVNLARSGEAYFYTYFKVKQLVTCNPGVKRVFVEISNNQLSEGMNDWIWEDNFLKDKYPRYSRFMSMEDYGLLFRHNAAAAIECEPLRMKDRLNLVFGRKKNFIDEYNWGGYLFNARSKVDSLLAARAGTLNDTADTGRSEINLAYLEKIKKLCDEKGVQLFLISCPLHPSYPRHREAEFQQLLKTYFSDVVFLDFRNFALPNSAYLDLEHLNYIGANEFSFFLNHLVEQGLLSAPNKQAFIETEMLKRSQSESLGEVTHN